MNASRQHDLTFRLWAIVSAGALLHMIVFAGLALAAPERLLVQYVPDDAFYYLTLARHFRRLGFWTFDGQSVTSGFHLLHAYLLAALAGLAPGEDGLLRAGVAGGALLTALLGAGVWLLGWRRRSAALLLALALALAGRNLLFNSVAVMEWNLVACSSAAYLALFYLRPEGREKRVATGLFALGMLGSLARTDFGLMPLALLAAALAVGAPRRDWGAARPALAGLAGAGLGLALALAHGYAFTGRLIQSSARMKQFWGRIEGPAYGTAAELPLSAVGVTLDDTLLLALLMLAALVLALLLFRRVRRGLGAPLALAAHPRELTLGLASALTIGGYVVFYAQSGAPLAWYTANLLAPVVALVALLVASLQAVFAGDRRLDAGISLLALLVIAVNLGQVYPLGGERAPYPHQQFMLEAGRALRAQPPSGRVGAWNAGIIGYYQGGAVVNLDGLVNDDIYPYAVANRLPEYLAARGITTIVDFQTMLAIPAYRRRGGYDDPAFLARLRPLHVFDDGRYPPWVRLTRYRVE